MNGLRTSKPGVWSIVALAVLLIAGGAAWAQDEPSSLAASDAEDLMGKWKLEMDFQGTPVEMNAEFIEEDGKTIAIVTSAMQPGELRISDITRDDNTLALKGAIEMGEGDQSTTINLVIDMEIDGDKVTGHVKDDVGFIDADISGGRAKPVSDLDTADLEDWLGNWTLKMDFQGREVEMSLNLTDADGKLSAILSSRRNPDGKAITDIAKTDDGLDLSYDMERGGQQFDLVMSLTLDDGEVAGTLGDTGGFFSTELTGTKGEGGADAEHAEGDGESEDAAAAEPFNVPAEDASKLDVADAKDYIGGWKLAMELRGNPMAMTLVLQDVEGKVGAYITSMFAPEPSVIEEIEMTDDGMKMLYEAQFGPQRLDINIVAKLEGGALAGSFADAGGLISADFTGERLTEKQVLASAQQSRRRGRGRRGGGDTGETRIKIEGQEIKISYAKLKIDSEDHKALENVKDGDVFTFTRGRASKLLTETDLKFGDVVLKQGNAHESYPGVYSLWLKKVGDGWHLVANEHADIWGTQHDPVADVAEIPLTLEKADSEEERFKIELVEDGMGGTLNLAWGDNLWSAKFSVTQ